MSGVVYVGQNGNYHHNSNGHAPSGLIADELESDENLQVCNTKVVISYLFSGNSQYFSNTYRHITNI